MDGIWVELVIIGALIGVNAVLTMAEFAVISARKTRLQLMAGNSVPGAASALELANSPSEFLAAVQVGITLIGILTGVFGGAAVAEPLAEVLKEISWIGPVAPQVSFGIVVVVLTYITLILGELVPKRIGLNNPEKAAAVLAGPLKMFSLLVRPFVRLLSFSTDLLVGILGSKISDEPEVTQEEVRVMVEQGTAAGVIEKAEEAIIKRALTLGDKRVDELMIPRPRIISIDLSDETAKNLAKMMDSPHSYFPAYEHNPDQIVGLVSIKDLWARTSAGKTVDLRASLVEPLYVMETVSALKVLELFKQSGKHIAVVIDEYGGTAGLITIIDIFTAIVGDLNTREQPVKAAAIKRKDGSWLVDGMMSIDSLKELLRLKTMPNEKGGDFQTLGGMIMTKMGRIPRETDLFQWEGWRFEVVDMDGLRVDKVLIAPAVPKKSKTEKSNSKAN